MGNADSAQEEQSSNPRRLSKEQLRAQSFLRREKAGEGASTVGDDAAAEDGDKREQQRLGIQRLSEKVCLVGGPQYSRLSSAAGYYGTVPFVQSLVFCFVLVLEVHCVDRGINFRREPSSGTQKQDK
jgi:hypothetical protein